MLTELLLAFLLPAKLRRIWKKKNALRLHALSVARVLHEMQSI